MNARVIWATILLSLLFAAFLFVGRLDKQKGFWSQKDGMTQDSWEGKESGIENFGELRVKQLPRDHRNFQDLREQESVFTETDLYKIQFSTYGASILSLKLKNYLDGEEPLDMILRGDHKNWGAFLLYFGKDNTGEPFYGPYTFEDKGNGVYEFQGDVVLSTQKDKKIPFKVTKTYRFLPNEYLFEVRVGLFQPNGDYLPLDFSGYSYNLETGPQMGPFFKKLDGSRVYRKPVFYDGRKAKFKRIFNFSLDHRVFWAGIDSKYFTMIGIPDESNYKKSWTNFKIKSSNGEMVDGLQLNFVRSLVRSSRQEDRFYFYFGPKKIKALKAYNHSDKNGFGLSNFNLDAISPSLPVFGWLQSFFKFLLELIYGFVGNWGWSIIILTFFVKVFLFPLSLKSMVSTARMGELAPKIKNLQEKYRDDPSSLHRAQFELYKREGINPVAGCLPLLMQIPIFIALYNLFNRFFELRGARFFGWINDLSSPDRILDFEKSLPFFNWRSLHILPFVYLFSQFLMNKITHLDSSVQTGQKRFFTWIMPLMFFFVFYEVASALLVYWIFSNLISIVQQLFIVYLKRKGFLKNFLSADYKNEKK